MTDWTTIPNTSIETSKPIRAIDGRALRDNPIAIAEAAAGAPRIAPRALQDPILGSGEFSGSAPLAFVGLSGVGAVSGTYLVYNASGSTAYAATLAFSNDNGATWGAAQNLFTAGTDLSVYHLHLELNIVTGAFRLAGAVIASSTRYRYLNTATLTVPTNCNGIRFGGAGANLYGNAALKIAGGRT